MFVVISDQIANQSLYSKFQFNWDNSLQYSLLLLLPPLHFSVNYPSFLNLHCRILMDLTLDSNNNSNFDPFRQSSASKALDDYLEELGSCDGEFTESK